ncbi:MAG: UDP-N-acetylmuramate:L-alanyl-gamma-D-glutamyl-meso-diaminopimelate ligase [Chromatiales bacterium 21-64-14]|nr:MAG: UDP-N-acetylmuramate:L-alanyl-gamma-D-glutamyl-meso-diaminopimelate ligase [Chromatiales bacterium 21-64-14]HQU16585.1 UDP-N-acetylmuramate:L-alanyl-gamma-D-glutamyl-meso-diaminopimelate ligase [Gammaproteobacteria bacterium]
MRIHILGICGTFMGGLALLARALGHEVQGSDANVYPPMSTQLAAQGVILREGYDPGHLEPAPDLVIVGNALSRGNPAVESLLDRGLPYTSGPQWLAEHVLQGRGVLAVAGTHGKTTTASLLTWILECSGLEPGFLIGGVPANFGVSARIGGGRYFVVEADEYDSAFFDKRSKFVHYRPRTLVLNNLEFDHADIFPDLAAIQRQFHHLIRTVPATGRILCRSHDGNLREVLDRGCWTPVERFALEDEDDAAAPWRACGVAADGSQFRIRHGTDHDAEVVWPLLGRHNVCNALAAVAAAAQLGVVPAEAARHLASFQGIRRRMELRGEVNGVRVYDDFAHHPTAIATTLQGLRRHVGRARVIVVLELRSNTLRMGVHRERLAPAVADADQVLLYRPPDLTWDLQPVAARMGPRAAVLGEVQAIVDRIVADARPGDHVVVMSNGAFGGIHERLLRGLGATRAPSAVP